MRCIICQKDTKPWCLVENKNLILDDEGNKIADRFQACSYSCCRKLDQAIGSQWCHNIMNREDFSWLCPIIPQNKRFVYLTANEIYELSDLDRCNYYNQRDNHIEIDVARANIQMELEQEDLNTMLIENETSSDEENYIDDYLV
jgi:hypothetical protein